VKVPGMPENFKLLRSPRMLDLVGTIFLGLAFHETIA